MYWGFVFLLCYDFVCYLKKLRQNRKSSFISCFDKKRNQGTKERRTRFFEQLCRFFSRTKKQFPSWNECMGSKCLDVHFLVPMVLDLWDLRRKPFLTKRLSVLFCFNQIDSISFQIPFPLSTLPILSSSTSPTIPTPTHHQSPNTSYQFCTANQKNPNKCTHKIHPSSGCYLPSIMSFYYPIKLFLLVIQCKNAPIGTKSSRGLYRVCWD